MNASEYQVLAARTLIDAPGFDIPDNDVMIVWNAIGLAGEAGEVAELVKKGIFHQHGLDLVKFRNEIGDVLWYTAALCTKCGFDMGEIMEENIEKLRIRYPAGYTAADSVRRVDVQEGWLLKAAGWTEPPGAAHMGVDYGVGPDETRYFVPMDEARVVVADDMFARGEMASSPATPETQVSKLPLSESEQLELMVIISRLQSEHSDLIERERVLEAEAADLRRQLKRAMELSAWHEPSEQMPIEFIPVVAYWQEDGAWNTVLYPLMPGLNDEGSRWYTHPDGSYRSAPVCWRYIPTPPGLVPDMVRDAMATQGETSER